MKRLFAPLILMGALAGMLAGCGVTPEPTVPPPTQTPWIIVVTVTPGPESMAQVQPTQTPWIIIATPTRPRPATRTPTEPASGSAAGPEPTAAPTQPPAAPIPTNTAEAESIIYPAPVLREPPSGVTIGWKGQVLLEWDSVGELADDEYYHLHLDAYREDDGVHWYGDYVYTKDTSYLAEGSFLAPFHPPEPQGRAKVYWWVRVVRKTGEDEHGKPVGIDVGLPSEKQFFMLDPKPSKP